MASATTRTTGTTEPVAQTVARANAMLAQTKAEGSKSFKGSSYEKSLASAIPATDLNPQASPQLPPAPVPQDVGPVVESNNAMLSTGLTANGLTFDQSTGQWSYAAPTGESQTPQDNFGGIFDAYMKQMSTPPDTLGIYNAERDRLGIDEKQRTFSNLSGKLNSITANRDARILRQEGFNEQNDVTKGVYSAQTSRIMRDAAIEALPVQAQLAAAQGDLQMAQETLNTMYQIKSQDAQAEWQFKQGVASSLFEFMNASEQRRLDKVMQEEERTYQEKQDFFKTQRSLLSSAMQQGAPQDVVSGIMRATTQEEAIQAAGEYNGDILARRAQEASINASYASIRAANANAALNEAELLAFNKAQEDAAKGVISSEQMETANALNKDFESQPVVKEYNEALAARGAADAVLEAGVQGVEDTMLIYNFMKSVDPRSVVREAEYDMALMKSGNIFQGTYAKFNGLFKEGGGQLSPEARNAFKAAMNGAWDMKNKQYYNVKSEYTKRINNTIGVANGADYLTAYEGAAPIGEADWEIVSAFEGATAEDIADIMNLTNKYSTPSR
jgi:hypothetical protein